MSLRRVKIEEATEAELREFANDALGITIPGNAKPQTVLAKVKEAWDKAEIMVTGPTPVPEGEDDAALELGSAPAAHAAAAPAPVTKAQLGPAPGKVRVHIEVNDEPGGTDPIFVSVNGKGMLIARGKDQDIPVRYWHALELAITHRFENLPDNKGINPIPRKVQAYPVRLVAEGPPLSAAKAA